MSSYSGVAALAQSGPPRREPGSISQAIVTAKANFDLNQGVKRNLDRKRMPDRVVIGGSMYQNYDPALDAHRGNVALIDTSKIAREMATEGAYDATPEVLASLAGYVVPPHIQNEWDWKSLMRPVGVFYLPVSVSSAEKGAQVAYGTTIAIGGATANVHHIVPEPIQAGQLLVCDIGPMDADARVAWSANFRYPHHTHSAASQKPVVRPFDPFRSLELLGAAAENYYSLLASSDNSAEELQQVANAARNGTSDYANPLHFASAAMERPVLSAVLAGVSLLAAAGYITFPLTKPKKATNAEELLKSSTHAKRVAEMTEVLGLSSALTVDQKDTALCAAIFGAFWQPMMSEPSLADAVSLKAASLKSDEIERIQNEGATELVSLITELHHRNTTNVVGRATENSQQGNDGLRIVLSQ